MINKLKYATISDIGIFDIYFYDENKAEWLIDFCADNGITYLPSKDRKYVYELKEGKFEKKELKEELCVNPYDRIFDDEVIEKFGAVNHNEIRFIIENGLIKGVVHIIDYNSEFIQVELYRAIYKFETNLRELLYLNGYNNDDFINWVQYKVETEKDKNSRNHWEKRLSEIKSEKAEIKRKEFKAFQTFYLNELLRFALNKGVISKEIVDVNQISNLRNQVAHSNDLTTYTKENDELIYNYQNLKKYVKQINSFFTAYDYINLKLEENNINIL
ncbi:hypothetical protein HX096_13415 [Empedobacter falsenii]|uniref:hypothetical protein n=1 Tax=Empedobacter falsenii TaxID=343874 RepID=UPI002574FF45|nr:hypothetical protein [Empedobacter falsenii]MDM1548851.1 hypothetical protein [Empedobacter falsenii]